MSTTPKGVIVQIQQNHKILIYTVPGKKDKPVNQIPGLKFGSRPKGDESARRTTVSSKFNLGEDWVNNEQSTKVFNAALQDLHSVVSQCFSVNTVKPAIEAFWSDSKRATSQITELARRDVGISESAIAQIENAINTRSKVEYTQLNVFVTAIYSDKQPELGREKGKQAQETDWRESYNSQDGTFAYTRLAVRLNIERQLNEDELSRLVGVITNPKVTIGETVYRAVNQRGKGREGGHMASLTSKTNWTALLPPEGSSDTQKTSKSRTKTERSS